MSELDPGMLPEYWMRCENHDCDWAFHWRIETIRDFNCLECEKPMHISRMVGTMDDPEKPPEDLAEDFMDARKIHLAHEILAAILILDDVVAEDVRVQAQIDNVYVLLEEFEEGRTT